MEEFFSSIIDYFKQRTNSPLFGAFFFSWSVWNFKFFVVVFSPTDLDLKLLRIDEVFLHLSCLLVWLPELLIKPTACLLNTLVFPSVLAYIYLYQYPKLAKIVYAHSLNTQNELKEAKQKALNARVITEEEKQKLLRDTESMRNKIENKNRELNERLNFLNNEVERLGKEKSNLVSALSKKDKEISEIKNSIESRKHNDLWDEDNLNELTRDLVPPNSSAKQDAQQPTAGGVKKMGAYLTKASDTKKMFDNELDETIFKSLAKAFKDDTVIPKIQLIESLVKVTGLTQLRIREKLNTFVKDGFLLNNGNYYNLTDEGNSFLVKNNYDK